MRAVMVDVPEHLLAERHRLERISVADLIAQIPASETAIAVIESRIGIRVM